MLHESPDRLHQPPLQIRQGPLQPRHLHRLPILMTRDYRYSAWLVCVPPLDKRAILLSITKRWNWGGSRIIGRSGPKASQITHAAGVSFLLVVVEARFVRGLGRT